MRITKQQACRFILSYQNLLPPKKLKNKNDILQFIKKVGCIQFDPLNIVGRNPDLVLQSRVNKYHPAILQELLYKDRKLVDGWDKMMSIYAIEDWPYFKKRRNGAKEHVKTRSHGEEILNAASEVKGIISKNGPVSSIDLKLNRKVDWHWGKTNLAKAVLENMYHSGELIVHHRVNTRRYYDLIENHLTTSTLNAKPFQSENEYLEWYALRRVGSVGLIWNKSGELWQSILKSKERNIILSNLLKKNKLKQIEVDGINFPFFIKTEDFEYFTNVITETDIPKKSSIIAPLDNIMWDRKMLEVLFDFKYRWEVYKPVKEREYGYYVLPILYGDKFIARFEPGFDKKQNQLLIKNWWWEKDLEINKKLEENIDFCLKDFCKFLETDSYKYLKK